MGIEIADGGASGMLHLTHTHHTVSSPDEDKDSMEDTRVRDWLSTTSRTASPSKSKEFEPRILSFSQWLVGELNAGDVVALTAVIFGVWFATMLTVTLAAVLCACVIKCVHQYVVYSKTDTQHVPLLVDQDETANQDEEDKTANQDETETANQDEDGEETNQNDEDETANQRREEDVAVDNI